MARRIARVFSTLVVAAGLLFGALLVLPAALGWQRYVIVSGSMTGTYDRGSLVLDEVVPVSELREGDVITYRPPAGSGPAGLVTHRIAEVTTDKLGVCTFRTKGDANEAADPWTFQLPKGEQARVRAGVPYVGFALADSHAAVLQRIEFVPLGGSRVLVIVVARGNQVTQKVVDAQETLRSDDLAQAASYLNTEFAGLPLLEVREAVMARLQQERTLYDQLLARALRLARSTLEELPRQQTFHVEGAASLLDGSAHEQVSMATLRKLLDMMEEKERMVQLLNAYIDGPGLTVVIGTEHAAPDLQRFSLIACTVVDGATTRTVGVIGPTRMR